MQNQNLLTREFSGGESAPKAIGSVSLDGWLYFGVVAGIILLAYETKPFWSPSLIVSAGFTIGLIGYIFARQTAALKSKIGLIEKITAQKEEIKFDNLIKDSSDITAIFRVDGVSLFLSPSIRNVLGYNHKVSVGTQSFDFIHPDDVEMVKKSYQKAFEDPDYVFTHEFRYKHLNGTWRMLEGVGRQYCDESGNPIGILHNSHDITERKLVEKQLRSYTHKLEQSNRELQEFAYVASHDLQEPLRKVQAFGDRLEKKCAAQLSDEGRDYIDRMRSAANRMQNLINDLLTFSRVSTKTQPFQPVDLKRIAEEVVSDLEIRIEQTGGRVEIGELPTLDADAVQIRQLFQNLIGNALKFHRADDVPVVKILAETVSSNGASFFLNGEEMQIGGDENFCRIAVEDNGIGFDEKYLDRIFTVFQRLHGRAEYEGSGIGLAVCRKIVERHGGQITAAGKPGAGATFFIDLPLIQEDINIHETKC